MTPKLLLPLHLALLLLFAADERSQRQEEMRKKVGDIRFDHFGRGMTQQITTQSFIEQKLKKSGTAKFMFKNEGKIIII